MIYVATNGNFLPKPFVQKIGASVIKRSEDELQVWSAGNYFKVVRQSSKTMSGTAQRIQSG